MPSIEARGGLSALMSIASHGSGWIKNRYQLSSCASRPHPCCWTPWMSDLKSVSSCVCCPSLYAVTFGESLPAFSGSLVGSHARKLPPFPSVGFALLIGGPSALL